MRGIKASGFALGFKALGCLRVIMDGLIHRGRGVTVLA
jgi:hypothetical protein